MNQTLGRLRLLTEASRPRLPDRGLPTEASATILTKRRPPGIIPGGRRLSVVLWDNHSCAKGLP